MNYEFLKSYKGTFFVNILGSFLIGFFLAVLNERNTNLNFLLIVGFTGGLTTFSTFSFEFAKMIIDKDFSRAFGYLSFNILLGFLSVYLFLKLIKI